MFFSYTSSKATVLRVASLVLTIAMGLAFSAQASTPKLKLHVPSPDWRDQIIYFLMTDRFEDGNPQNNDQGAGEYDPKKGSRPRWPTSGGMELTAAITATGPLTSSVLTPTWAT